MTDFLHPEEAMRAKILDRLDCRWCVSFHTSDATWCRRQRLPPADGIVKELHCKKFRLLPKIKMDLLDHHKIKIDDFRS